MSEREVTLWILCLALILGFGWGFEFLLRTFPKGAPALSPPLAVLGAYLVAWILRLVYLSGRKSA